MTSKGDTGYCLIFLDMFFFQAAVPKYGRGNIKTQFNDVKGLCSLTDVRW